MRYLLRFLRAFANEALRIIIAIILRPRAAAVIFGGFWALGELLRL